jgi:hypothetical protein
MNDDEILCRAMIFNEFLWDVCLFDWFHFDFGFSFNFNEFSELFEAA